MIVKLGSTGFQKCYGQQDFRNVEGIIFTYYVIT